MSKKKSYLNCPECGAQEFDEIALIWSRQGGIKLTSDGADYEDSGTIEPDDVMPEKAFYQCRNCRNEFCFVDGKLTKDTPTEKVKNKRVVIEVNGGVASVTSCPDGVMVKIIDHDNR